MRCLVALEMFQRADWVVPTVGSEPYLAKPPLIYWCQLLLANALGHEPGVLHLRLTVALAATLGVLLVYHLGRSLFGRPDQPIADHAAFWAAAFCATGILYVRSGRIGELDILLAPTVALAVYGIWTGYRAYLEGSKRTHIGAMLVAALGASLAMLAKGPPGLLVVALAGYGGIALHTAAQSGRALGRGAIGAGVAAAAAAVLAYEDAAATDDWLGLALLALAAGAFGATLGPLADPATFGRFFKACTKTHPVGVLLVPVGVLWLWGRAVASRIGEEAVSQAAKTEAGENLRVLVPESPLNNLEAAAFGVGIGSAAAIIALVWFLKDRPRFHAGWWIVAAWVGLGLAAFSLLGKGVPRYLTPIWPGIALLGGLWFAHWLRDVGPRARRVGTLAATLGVLVLAIGQGWWYAQGRELHQQDRSPRDLVAELLASPDVRSADEIAVFNLWSPALDFYLGQPAERFDGSEPDADIPGGKAPPVAELLIELQNANESRVLLVRETPHPRGNTGMTGAQQLAALGFDVTPIALNSQWMIDNRRTNVTAVRVRPAPH